MMELTLSPLGHTWILDLDGTLVKHNGYMIDGFDTMQDGASDFVKSLPEGDMVVIITSRSTKYKEMTELFLAEQKVRYDYIIYNAPYGERILINDKKPSGLTTALSINCERNIMLNLKVRVDEKL